MRKRKLRAPKSAPPKAKGKASPEMQKQYDYVMMTARKVLYGDPKTPNDDTRFKMVLERLAQAKDNLSEAIGGITAVVLTNIAGAAKKQGRTIPTPVLFHAGREIIADLIEIAVAAKITTQDQAGPLTQQSVMAALKAYKAGNAAPQPGQAQAAPPAPAQPAAPMAPPAAPPQAPGIINAARGVPA